MRNWKQEGVLELLCDSRLNLYISLIVIELVAPSNMIPRGRSHGDGFVEGTSEAGADGQKTGGEGGDGVFMALLKDHCTFKIKLS